MMTVQKIEYLKSDWVDTKPEKPVTYPWFLSLIRLGFGTLGRVFPRAAAAKAYELFSTPRSRAKHRTPEPILSEARIFDVLFGKHLLKCYAWGSGERTVLLVHGWESRGTALRTFVPDLVERGYRVVAMDGPAHGDSGGRRVNIRTFGHAVQTVIRRLGNVQGVITHSFGGAATVFALSELDNSISLEKLVLIGTPNRMEKVFQMSVRTLGLPPRAARHYRRLIEEKVGKSLSEAALSELGLKAKVGEALIVHDTTDQAVPLEAARLIAESWPHARMLITEGYGHYRLMKNPDVIRQVTGFVGE
jgi:pimeloyl-ACP methyl ester carboxylesterase